MEKVAVIGAGVMGSGIAAHIANAGIPVLLFDIEKPSATLEKMIAQGPSGPFMQIKRAGLVEPLSLQSDLARVSECDWICEVIVEKLEAKQDLYARLEQHRRAHAVISSNTSTIPLAQLVEGRSQAFREHFCITHFFNPPRPMRLLEFVQGEDTLGPVAQKMKAFCEEKLGKGVVPCFDRPGFIANRIGVFWLMAALHDAIEHKINIDAADAALNKIYGIPKTGAFGLMDLIGLDLMPKMTQSLASNLFPDDPFHKIAQPPKLMNDMIGAGYTGRKGKGGFNRMLKNADGSKTKLSLDITKDFDPDTSYRPSQKAAPAEDWAKRVMDRTLDYAASLLGEVSDDKAAIDAAMVWGYGWKKGPFALRGEKIVLPHAKGAVFVHDFPVITENEHAMLRDMGDGVFLFCLKTKMNVLEDCAFEMLLQTLDHGCKGLVIATDETHFSAGANVARFLEKEAESFIDLGRETMRKLRNARFPVVAAINGFAIGGGCELALHSTAIVAHAETNIGLVEPRVGVIPGWGGCIEAHRRLGPVEALKTILAEWTSSSALDAQDKGYLAKGDIIVMNRDLLLAEAKHIVHSLTPKTRDFTPANAAQKQEMQDWLAASNLERHNRLIADSLTDVLSSQSEEDMWQRERDHFMRLLQTDEARKRIEAVLAR